MRLSALAAVSLSPLLLFAFTGPTLSEESPRITGPLVHENLAVYFVHGKSASGKVPLTLEEAMAKGVVKVRETSNVNELEVENLGNDEVFVQSGDIVKGGKQDRTLMVSLVLPPKSGRISIASFCVEQGRWSARGREDAAQFASASAAVPSRELKLAMKAPRPVATPPKPGQFDGDRRILPYVASAANETSERQREVWASVSKTQAQLAGTLGAPVRAKQSESSLQLAMENEKLIDTQQTYVKALKAAGEAGDDVVGYIFAVNGKINSADVYPSNGLFRKMWTKLLNASAIEAIGHRDDVRDDAPSIEAVTAFLTDAEKGAASDKPLNTGVHLETREGSNAYLFETARVSAPASPAAWVHRNYLAK